MKTNFLTTENTIYLVEFKGNHKQYFFNSDLNTLGDLVKKFNRYGIEKICRYEQSKLKFKKLSQKDVIFFFSYDQYTIDQLKKTNFIK